MRAATTSRMVIAMVCQPLATSSPKNEARPAGGGGPALAPPHPSPGPPAPPRRILPNRWALVAAPLIFGVFVLFAIGARQMSGPLAVVQHAAISLDPAGLPVDALRTVLR